MQSQPRMRGQFSASTILRLCAKCNPWGLILRAMCRKSNLCRSHSSVSRHKLQHKKSIDHIPTNIYASGKHIKHAPVKSSANNHGKSRHNHRQCRQMAFWTKFPKAIIPCVSTNHRLRAMALQSVSWNSKPKCQRHSRTAIKPTRASPRRPNPSRSISRSILRSSIMEAHPTHLLTSILSAELPTYAVIIPNDHIDCTSLRTNAAYWHSIVIFRML